MRILLFGGLLASVVFSSGGAVSMLSNSVSASLRVPGFCSIIGVPSAIKVILDDTRSTDTSLNFRVSCNFNRTASISITSSCVRNGRACLLDTSGEHFVNYTTILNSQVILPAQEVAVGGNTVARLQLVFDPAPTMGVYSSTNTITINY